MIKSKTFGVNSITLTIIRLILFALVALGLSACANHDNHDEAQSISFMGRVSIGSQAPLADADVLIRDARTHDVLDQIRTNRDGYFIASGVKSGSDVVVTATDGHAHNVPVGIDLTARNTSIAPGAFVWVTPETTIMHRVHTQSPEMTDQEVERRTHRALGLPTDLPFMVDFTPGRLHHSSGTFGHTSFLAAAEQAGGTDKLLEQLTEDALADQPNASFPVMETQESRATAPQATDEMLTSQGMLTDAGTFIGKGLASGALSEVGSLATGWLLDAIGIPSPPNPQITALQNEVEQNHEMLENLSNQISDLSTQINDIGTAISNEIHQLKSSFARQYEALMEQSNQGEYQSTYEIASSYANQLEQWMDTLSGYLSHIQSPPPGQTLGMVMDHAAAFAERLNSASPGPEALQLDLLDLLTAQAGTRSIYKQFSDVVFGPSFYVLNASGSAILTHMYNYWSSVMLHAEYMAMEVAHYEYNSIQAQTALDTANYYFDNTMQPAQLPSQVALQLGGYDPVAGVFRDGSDLMWAVDVLPDITSSDPYVLSAVVNLVNTGLSGTVAGPNGTTLDGWQMATGDDIWQLFTFASANGENMAEYIPALLGLSATYTANLNGSGWWDTNFDTCFNNNNELVPAFLPTSSQVVSCTNPVTKKFSSSGYWFAYRLEPNKAQYLPAN